MTVEAPDFAVSRLDRALVCQEAVEPDIKRIVEEANAHGWGAVEVITAVEEVLKNLRVAYAKDPPNLSAGDEDDPSNDWPGD